MRKPALLLVLIFELFITYLQAQQPCAFDIKHEELKASNPVFARLVEDNNAVIRQRIEARKSMKPGAAKPMAVVYIPVVVHVMHTGGAVGTIYNPTDAQIIGAIDYLNDVYAGSFPGMSAPIEGGGIVDLEVQFALAQRTPSCGATNGINRVDASSLPNYVANGINASNSTGCPELTLKNFARWNTADYYNIWVVNKIDGADGTSGQFIAGYAYFPGAPSSLDGTVMLATQMQSGEKTLPHEVGHALGLYHTFQGSNNSSQCPANVDCSIDGDRVCDTDPVSRNSHPVTGVVNFSCRTGANGCDNPNNYTINTESNFMGYTNCYTLFTNGQKDRLQAALTLPSRTSLIDPSNLALTPCGTTINFSQAGASRTEDITGTLTGCRRYRDYTYQLAIGAAPSATATATLSYSGTGTRGVDYDVTTNGNFTTPSDVLTFTTGATTAQSFTIRVYDDGDVESNETAVLDFTVNNGGGDATKGIITPTFSLTIGDNDLAPAGTSSGTYAVGVASSAINATPFDARQQRHRAQFLYKASELTSAGVLAGNITAIDLSVQSKLSSRPFENFTIRMAHAGIPYLVDGSVFLVGGLSTVYSNASYSSVAGWNSFNLTTPFAWDGINNVLIEICFENAAADAGNGADVVRTFLDGGLAAQGNMFYENGISCAQDFGSVSYYGSGRKPIIRFGNNVVGTPIETSVSSVSSHHMEETSTDYFYSNNDRLMMRLSNIDAPLGCVSATLDEAGSTWLSYMGGQRSGKVFSISPTTNGSTASYTVSLYFENAELGGKNPATLRLAKTSAASVALSNQGNTEVIVPSVTTLGTGATIFTASFTGFSRFFLVDAGAILPVVLTEFSGKVNTDRNALLTWRTSSEYNSRSFDLETGRDGINFERLSTITAVGNSATEQQYEYTHIAPPAGLNYYRLRQIDLDGKMEYSKIISLLVDAVEGKVVLYPVPATDKLNIDFGGLSGVGEIEIFSAEMKLMKRETVDDMRSTKTITVAELAKGIYFVRYNNGSQTGILQFVKN